MILLHQSFKSEYSNLQPILEAFSEELSNQLKNQIREKNIKLAFPFQSRVKTLDSIIDKIDNKRFVPKKSILEIQDLVGFRFVTLYKKDILEIENIIKSFLSIKKKINLKEKWEKDKFGYSSHHFIVTPPESWKSVNHLSKFINLIAEIQVRTLSEHIWAECSHSLNYKSTLNIPKNIERPLYRLSAILEIVDDELNNILKSHTEYKNLVESLDLQNLLEEDFNGLTLQKLLNSVFPDNKHLEEGEYSYLNKILEEDYEIRTLSYLLTFIHKYKPVIETDSNLNHRDIMFSILEHYKINSYF